MHVGASDTPIVAIIPARGGSKGVPRKNLRRVRGSTLLEITIRQALASRRIAIVCVSTDDDEVAACARHLDARVISRPSELATDTASSESALLHALNALREEGVAPELVALLQATSPLRRHGQIDCAIATLEDAGADSLFSACPVEGFVWRLVDGRPMPLDYELDARPCRQDKTPTLIENGSIYVFRPRVLQESGARLGGVIQPFPMDPLDSLQVDTFDDLRRIERVAIPGAIHAGFLDEAVLANIRLLALDFDGVLTDDRVSMSEAGAESVACSRSDGFGIERLREAGVQVVVVSREVGSVVAARCGKMRIACQQGQRDKRSTLETLADRHCVSASEIAYVGNDAHDVQAMRWAGWSAAPSDAREEALRAARHITSAPGGRGAIREVCELLLAARARSGARSIAPGIAGEAANMAQRARQCAEANP